MQRKGAAPLLPLALLSSSYTCQLFLHRLQRLLGKPYLVYCSPTTDATSQRYTIQNIPLIRTVILLRWSNLSDKYPHV